jgi:hypothetical protein
LDILFSIINHPVMKIHKLLILLVLFPTLLSARPLSKNEIIDLGTRAYHQKAQNICPQAANAPLKSYELLKNNGNVDMAVLHFGQGFLILSADDAIRPILAYSFEGDIDMDQTTPAIWVFLSQYRFEISVAQRLQLSASPDIQAEWDALRNPTRASSTEIVVAPLIHSTWNQDKYYNYLCPRDHNASSGYDGHVPNGCVAVAMSQIMFYYRYPATGSGSHTNFTEYGNFYVNFGQQHYNYNAMCDKLHNYNNEVAKLIFHSGTAVDMMYGTTGSGAYSNKVPTAMATYFNYSPDAVLLYKQDYSDSVWLQMLIADLEDSHPLYYAGKSEEGGHAFICDGYNSDEYFHFNFGWNGSGNAYYSITNNDSVQNAVGGFNSDQAAIFNLYPLETNYPSYCQGGLITAANGTLEDGSGPYDYQNNTFCTYILTNPSQSSVQITIQSLATQEEHDFLRFWDGQPAEDNLLLSLSGAMPAEVSHNFYTDSLYITFETDDSITDSGWRISFMSERTGDGCGTSVALNNSGIITDNSGENNYTDNSECSWIIRPTGVEYITFNFEEFDLSPEDHLGFYDLTNNSNELLGEFSGNNPPAHITYNIDKIAVRFFSDNDLNAQGFYITWFATNTGIANADLNTTLYPNPATDVLHISFNEPVEDCVTTLYDMVGNLVFTQSFQQELDIEIPVHQLPNGIYVLSLKDGERILHKKIIINH